jgi:hypothetical protein
METHLAARLALVLAVIVFLGWGGDLFAELLPGTSIEQFWDKSPSTTDDWLKEGFVAGYYRPYAKPVRPLMVTNDRADAFVSGFKEGQNAYKTLAAKYENEYRKLPAIEAGIRGERYDELEREYRELLEAIFHKHMPHTEVDETARMPIVVPGRGVR